MNCSGSLWKKVVRPSQRKEMAEKGIKSRGISIALAFKAFGFSETCLQYKLKLKSENEQIEDLLIGLTNTHKT